MNELQLQSGPSLTTIIHVSDSSKNNTDNELTGYTGEVGHTFPTIKKNPSEIKTNKQTAFFNETKIKL